jgi:hypothetical protein
VQVTPVPLWPYGDPGKINLIGTPQVLYTLVSGTHSGRGTLSRKRGMELLLEVELDFGALARRRFCGTLSTGAWFRDFEKCNACKSTAMNFFEWIYLYFENASEAFVPPNPKLLERDTSTSFCCADNGT